jgi:hypothetical protein
VIAKSSGYRLAQTIRLRSRKEAPAFTITVDKRSTSENVPCKSACVTTAAIFASVRDEPKPLRGGKRLCFLALRFGGAEQKTDEFGLPVRSGLLENVREMGFGRCIRNTAPPRGRLAAITP